MCTLLTSFNKKYPHKQAINEFSRNKQLRAHLISEANDIKAAETSTLSQLIEDTAPVRPHLPTARPRYTLAAYARYPLTKCYGTKLRISASQVPTVIYF